MAGNQSGWEPADDELDDEAEGGAGEPKAPPAPQVTAEQARLLKALEAQGLSPEQALERIKKAESPGPRKNKEDDSAPVTRGEAKRIAEEAERRAEARARQAVAASQENEAMQRVIQHAWEQGNPDWCQAAPPYVKRAALAEVGARLAKNPEVAKMDDASFKKELDKVAREVLAEQAPVKSTTQADEDEELESRLEARKRTGETGALKKQGMRKLDEAEEADEYPFGISEETKWPSGQEIESQFDRDMKKFAKSK